MATIAEAIALANQYHRAGNFTQAEQLYRQILAADPSQVDTANALGIILATLGRPQEAVACFRQAIQWQPYNAAYHSNLGNVLSASGRHEEAAASHWQSLQLDPNSAATYNNLGSALFAANRLDEARQCFLKALQLRPQYAEACNNLGTVFGKEGHIIDAMPYYRQAIALKPDYADAWRNLGDALKRRVEIEEGLFFYQETMRLRPKFMEAYINMAMLLCGLNRFEEALSFCQEAQRLQPDSAKTRESSAAVLAYQAVHRSQPAPAQTADGTAPAANCQELLEEAIRCYRESLRLQPGFADAYNSLGSVLHRQGKLDEALLCYQETIRLQPNSALALSNLGIVALRQNRLDDAKQLFEEALRLEPDLAVVHWNRSLLWLLQGNFEQGWAEYEWRWTQPSFIRRDFAQPRWDGSSLQGKTILLYPEQGLGDTLQFIRYARLLKERGAQVVVECQPTLACLLAGVEGIDRLVVQGSPLPAFDVHAPLLSLPGIFRTDLATIPAKVPYLHVDAQRVERWRAELGRPRRQGGASLHLGIVWQGHKANTQDLQRSIPLGHFMALAGVEGVQLISLQKGPGTEQLHALKGQLPIIDLDSRLGDPTESFANVAAVIENLDLVICCDTAIAHLAGALAVPVWVAVPVSPDWRWFMHREDSPWYPTMRLYRQTSVGNWQSVFERIASELRRGLN